MQWEFAGRLGPPPGRYVVRRYAGDVVGEVVVVTAAEAPRRRLLRSAPGAGVPVTRVTVIDASGTQDAEDAAWQRRAAACLARFLSAHRVASAEPDAPDPGLALALRVGTGTGTVLAEGGWAKARELPLPDAARVPRRSRHRPAERLAAVMAARDVTLVCEELTLRARGDLDHGRDPQAALQVETALSTAVTELAGWIAHGDLAERLRELGEHLAPVGAAAQAAREGRLEPDGVAAVAAALERLEAAIRARALYAAE